MLYPLINDDKGVLDKLVEVLEKFGDEYIRIPEIAHLENFDKTEELTIKGFSPKWIIESMLEKHNLYQRYVVTTSNTFKKFSYVHVNKCDETICQYTFTNVMLFQTDVYILCHLYFLISRCGLDKWPSVMELMNIMIEKYGISTEPISERESSLNLNPPADVVTLSRIAHSYPSITMEIFNYNINATAFFLSSIFPPLYNLSTMICSPIISSLLPFSQDPPLAVLIAINLLLENHSGLQTKTPLTTIFLRIFREYKSKVFPESLKYELCWKWKIINAEYKNNIFSSNYALCCKIAKNLIIEMRPEESSLPLLLPLL
ncbi:uncharacterized protein [Linepithema humile]|uniref:Uncharacterized protein n=1 Tax=Linepithema humile bunyan-like virus 1 TaxID=2259778 RepID=A0A2Z4Z408_9VIRU|nr:PREDICTED: uncharacterized protein LOC105678217 [Linepithema humile]AXA52549.1 hypothetical protein [Linepithema humile bunyan-like virus 1]